MRGADLPGALKSSGEGSIPNRLDSQAKKAVSTVNPNEFLDYTVYPCVCGHMESSHLRVSGICRGRRCGCKEFSNVYYLIWRQRVIAAETLSLAGAVERLVTRMELAAGMDAEKALLFQTTRDVMADVRTRLGGGDRKPD